MAKMSKKWVVACTAALGAIYSAEYFLSESRAAEQTSVTLPAMVSPQAESPAPTPEPAASPEPSPSQEPAPSPESSPAGKVYADGKFTGMGSNRRGSIQVTVTIKSDKITDVEISDFAMHYSISDVVGLPDEVLQYQSSQVDNVSGATYSVRAFEDAVQDALDQAKLSA